MLDTSKSDFDQIYLKQNFYSNAVELSNITLRFETKTLFKFKFPTINLFYNLKKPVTYNCTNQL